MDAITMRFIRGIYGREELPFIYFKDKYALQLLSYSMEADTSIAAIKKSQLGFLLQKPILKHISASLSNNQLEKTALQNFLPETYHAFGITIDKWGEKEKKHRKDSYYQTTRPGQSLVLQLNFTAEHDKEYYRLVKPRRKDYHPFRICSHPVAAKNRLTMAWARIDLDFDTGEVLIEEIQNDWLRQVISLKKRLPREKNKARKHWIFNSIAGTPESFAEYSEQVIKPYHKIWDEAILSAAITFCKEELGLHEVYFHTYESGNKLKECEPPRSIYSKLPKRFNFELTKKAPRFIRKCQYLKKTLRKGDLSWWKFFCG